MTERVNKKLFSKFFLFFLPDSLPYLGKFEQNKFFFFIACLKFCVEEFLVDVQCRSMCNYSIKKPKSVSVFSVLSRQTVTLC